MRRASRSAPRRCNASTSKATNSTRSGTTPSLHAPHNTPHRALISARALIPNPFEWVTRGSECDSRWRTRRFAMPVPLRTDFTADAVRVIARETKDGPQARRLLALAAIYEGAYPTEAPRRG